MGCEEQLRLWRFRLVQNHKMKIDMVLKLEKMSDSEERERKRPDRLDRLFVVNSG